MKKTKALKKAASQVSSQVSSEVAIQDVLPGTNEDAKQDEGEVLEAPAAQTASTIKAPPLTKNGLVRISNVHAKLMIDAMQNHWNGNKTMIATLVPGGKPVTKAFVVNLVFNPEWLHAETGLILAELPYTLDQVKKLIATYLKF